VNEKELKQEIDRGWKLYQAEKTVFAALHPSRIGDNGPTEEENRAAWTLAKAWLDQKGWMG